MTRIRTGLVGLGVMGRHHLRVLTEDENFDFVGVFDSNISKENDRGFTKFHDLKTLLQQDLEYCVISVPTLFHAEVFEEVSSHCKSILIEKPVANDSLSATRMIKLASDRGIKAGVGHIERYNPAVQLMRTLILQNYIGEIVQITTRRQGPFPQRIQDVGVIKDLATHDIDITQWVTGTKYLEISAFRRKLPGSKHEDLVSVSGTLDSDILFNHIVNWRYPTKERVVTVLGTTGALVADLLTSDLTYFENGSEPVSWGQMSLLRGNSEGSSTKFAVNKIEPLKSEHRAMSDFIRSGNSQNVVTLEQGLENLKVAERMLAD